MSTRYFGAAVPRLEDPRLLTGRGTYVDDVVLPGMLHAVFLRSSVAHGRVRNLDPSAALSMPGVRAVYAMADFAGFGSGPMPAMAPHPLLKSPVTCSPLAVDEVRYVGEAIAMVLADSRAEAEDALATIELDIEHLPVVANARQGIADGAPRAHSGRDSNVIATLRGSHGNVDAVFAAAAHRFSETFEIHRGGCHAMECRGVVAAPEPRSGELSLWTSSQSPYMVRRHLATYLGRDEADIRVTAPDVGGGFGPKANVYPEEFAVALAALACGRPVKWIEDRQEHFLATTQQRDQFWSLEVACDATGRMLGVRGHCIHDNGAYAPYGLILPATALASFPGPYALAAFDLSIDVVLTNLVPTSPVRGAGRPNAAFVLERLADTVARRLNLPREEVRRRSFVRAEQMPYVTGGKCATAHRSHMTAGITRRRCRSCSTRSVPPASRGAAPKLRLAAVCLDSALRPASRTPALGRSRAPRSASRRPARLWSRRALRARARGMRRRWPRSPPMRLGSICPR